MCLLVVAKGSSSEHRPMYFAFRLLMGEMLDVARYGLQGGKLGLVCPGWYA